MDDLGYTQGDYADVLLPGIVAFTAFLTALQNTAFPLVIDFSYTREIEDRLLAPLPTTMVAAEKMVFAALRAIVSSVLMLPIGWIVLGWIPLTWSELPLVLSFLVLGALVGAGVGMTIGTLVTAQKINIVFALVLTPLLFTGATQFPWPELDSLRWFQVLCALNPLTYVSEGLRAATVPEIPHIPAWLCALVLIGFLAAFTLTGMFGFRRRALD